MQIIVWLITVPQDAFYPLILLRTLCKGFRKWSHPHYSLTIILWYRYIPNLTGFLQKQTYIFRNLTPLHVNLTLHCLNIHFRTWNYFTYIAIKPYRMIFLFLFFKVFIKFSATSNIQICFYQLYWIKFQIIIKI